MRGALAVCAIVLLSGAGRLLAAEPIVVELYPGVKLPSEALGEEQVKALSKEGPPKRFISNVTKPTLTIYLPPAEKNTGAAVIICPGGGYGGVAIDHEGYDVAQWFNTVGVAGLVLK